MATHQTIMRAVQQNKGGTMRAPTPQDPAREYWEARKNASQRGYTIDEEGPGERWTKEQNYGKEKNQ